MALSTSFIRTIAQKVGYNGAGSCVRPPEHKRAKQQVL